MLTSNAIQFLASVADRQQYKSLFEDANTLASICEKIIVPNIEMREVPITKLSIYTANSPEQFGICFTQSKWRIRFIFLGRIRRRHSSPGRLWSGQRIVALFRASDHGNLRKVHREHADQVLLQPRAELEEQRCRYLSCDVTGNQSQDCKARDHTD